VVPKVRENNDFIISHIINLRELVEFLMMKTIRLIFSCVLFSQINPLRAEVHFLSQKSEWKKYWSFDDCIEIP
jgi:hypothetical protein